MLDIGDKKISQGLISQGDIIIEKVTIVNI